MGIGRGLVGGVQAQACRWGRIGKRCITYVLGPKICYDLELAWAAFAILGSKAWKAVISMQRRNVMEKFQHCASLEDSLPIT